MINVKKWLTPTPKVELFLIIGLVGVILLGASTGLYFYRQHYVGDYQAHKTELDQKLQTQNSELSTLEGVQRKIESVQNYKKDESSEMTLLKNLQQMVERIDPSQVKSIEPMFNLIQTDDQYIRIPVTVSFQSTYNNLVDFFRYFKTVYPEPEFQNLKIDYNKDGNLDVTVTALSTSINFGKVTSYSSNLDSLIRSVDPSQMQNVFGVFVSYDQIQDASSTQNPGGGVQIGIGSGTQTPQGNSAPNIAGASTNGEKVLPIRDTYTITSPFGKRANPFDGTEEFHHGVDLGVPVGTTIYSVSEGTVDFVGSGDIQGNYIVINSKDGHTKFYYQHLSQISVKEKDMIKAGDVLGLSGDTGKVTGPHLHFGVAVDGEFKDPMTYAY